MSCRRYVQGGAEALVTRERALETVVEKNDRRVMVAGISRVEGSMQKRAIGYVCLLVLMALAASASLRAQNDDQGKPATYTYIAEWAVPRAQWADMVKVDDQERSLMDKLVADGTLV